MNQNLELVEKLVEKTGISYAEAKEALEKTEWDILEAMILLESEGKVRGTKTTSAYTTQQTQQARSEGQENFKRQAKNFGDWVKGVIDKGNTNFIEMYRRGDRKVSIPVTVFVILLIFCFWFVLPFMFISLFFECRYSFRGADLGKDSVNNAMAKATDIADNIKSEINKKPE